MARKKATVPVEEVNTEEKKEQAPVIEADSEGSMSAELVETAIEEEAADIEPIEKKDDGMLRFQERLKELSAFAKKKKNVLE